MAKARKISDDSVARILYVSPGLMLATRLVGLLAALTMGGLELVAYYLLKSVPVESAWLIWPTALTFFAVGIVQFAWLPISRQKISIWINCFLVLGIIISSTIFGFNSAIFLGWLLLIIVMAIYISRLAAWIGWLAMVASLIIATINFGASNLGYVIASAVMIGLIIFITNAVWHVANRSLDDLSASHSEVTLEQKRLNASINNMVDGVLAVDSNLRISEYNAAALDILDVNGSIEGKPLATYLKPLDSNNSAINIAHYLRELKRAEIRRDLKLRYSDDSEIALYLASAPVRLGYGHDEAGFTLILRDITREKSLEDERNEFISVVSHELRTPIAIAEGNISNVQFIMKNAKSANRPELITKSIDEAHKQVLFLADMINDLSTLSRAERGKLELEVAPIKVVDLMNELLDNYSPEAKSKGLKLSLKSNPKLPELKSSELYVREILQNFITNALKYTEKGGITIEAKARTGGVEFAVKDTGIGLSKSDKEKVFDKFFRSEDYRTRKTGGTGLGLYVTMKLARLLHAELTVESELNHGSTFRIFFPDLGR